MLAEQTVRRYTKAAAMRVYVPLTLPALRQAYGAGELGPAPFEAYAVTPGLREWYGSEDAEELEYAALGRAAHASLRLLAEAEVEAQAARRIVVVAEVPDADTADIGDEGTDPGEERAGRVRIGAAVPFRKAAAVHADADDAVADVSAAAEALPAARGGDEAAWKLVDGAEEHELLWFATQEIPALLEPARS